MTRPVVKYHTVARIRPMTELVGKRPTPTRVVAARAGGTASDGSGWIPAHVFVEQDEDTYTLAAAEKLGRAVLAAAKWAAGR